MLVSARIRGIYEGNWADVWTDSFSALATEAAPTQSKEKRLNLDVQLIRIALQDEDTRAALRVTDGKASMAPESKAIRSLPSMFPKGQVPPWPNADLRTTLTKQEDMNGFLKSVRADIAYAMTRRGPGTGGSTAELWSFTAREPDEVWEPIGQALLNLALGNAPADALCAIYSSRVIALDRLEEDKTRPVAMGNFLRKCVNKAKARIFKKRVVEAIGDTDYSLGGDRTAELMHKTVLTDFDSNEDYVLHKFDISNAHNEFSRAAAIEAITDAVPELLPWAAGELCTSTHHAYTGHSGKVLWLEKSMGGSRRPHGCLDLPVTVLTSSQRGASDRDQHRPPSKGIQLPGRLGHRPSPQPHRPDLDHFPLRLYEDRA